MRILNDITWNFNWNWREIACKLVENILKFHLWNMVLGKKNLKNINLKRHLSMSLWLGMG
jgi:hypothetical protein